MSIYIMIIINSITIARLQFDCGSVGTKCNHGMLYMVC